MFLEDALSLALMAATAWRARQERWRPPYGGPSRDDRLAGPEGARTLSVPMVAGRSPSWRSCGRAGEAGPAHRRGTRAQDCAHRVRQPAGQRVTGRRVQASERGRVDGDQLRRVRARGHASQALVRPRRTTLRGRRAKVFRARWPRVRAKCSDRTNSESDEGGRLRLPAQLRTQPACLENCHDDQGPCIAAASPP